jgi:hypothetical protein
MKDDIEGPLEFNKESASLRLPLTQKWLELLTSDEITKSEVEHLAEQVFDIESIDNQFLWVGSHLFFYISNWAEGVRMRTTKIKSWREELRVMKYIKYYETDSDDKIAQAAYRISKRWLELINTSSATQNDIDSLMRELLSPKEIVGSMHSTMTYEFRKWAEGYGFNVPSYKQVREHYDSIHQAWVKKIREENRSKNEK